MGDTETFMLLTGDNVGVVEQTLTLTNNATGQSTNLTVNSAGQASATIASS